MSDNYQNKLLLIASIILLQLTPGIQQQNIPLLDEVDAEETVSTCRALHFPVPLFVPQREALFPTSLSTLLRHQPDSTVGFQYTAEKEGSKEGGRYNRTARGYCIGRLHNGRRCPKITLWFYNGCTRFNKKAYYCKNFGRDCFTTYLDSLVHHF